MFKLTEDGKVVYIHWILDGVNKDHSKYLSKWGDLKPRDFVSPFQTLSGTVLYEVLEVEPTDVDYLIRIHYKDHGYIYGTKPKPRELSAWEKHLLGL